MRTLVLLLAAAAGLAGCGSSSDDPVDRRAAGFYEAIANGDGAAACAALAPGAKAALEEQEGSSCTAVILDQHLPEAPGSGRVRVYGSMAQVSYASETAFLSRFDDGWRLTAVGCAPTTGDQPHSCTIEVG
jgi:hypothetical protein